MERDLSEEGRPKVQFSIGSCFVIQTVSEWKALIPRASQYVVEKDCLQMESTE